MIILKRQNINSSKQFLSEVVTQGALTTWTFNLWKYFCVLHYEQVVHLAP